jgi:hypothetical protein
MTSSRVTSRIAPPPASSGSPSRSRPTSAPEPNGAVTATRSKRSARSARSVASRSSPAERVNGSRRTSWRRHGSMLAWCSTGLLRTRAPAGSDAASTLIASVVLRTNTTPSLGRAPRNSAITSRASSYAAVATRDLNPLPRCTLLYHGTNASTAFQTSLMTGVLAALSRFA